ncbi:MAG: cardiolipin synthase ClsB [Burkholderiales bacterium]
MPDFVGGNRITLLRNGAQYFPDLVAVLDAAQVEIYLETYIFADDETGSLIAAALARAAVRGVATHLLIDGFGSIDFPARLRSLLEQAGVALYVYRPRFLPWKVRWPREPLRRMHRKLASVDGAVAFVGGINVIEDFETPERSAPRRDYAVRIEGPLAARVRDEAAKLWRRVGWLGFKRRLPGFVAPEGRGRQPTPLPILPAGNQRAALVVRNNLRHRRDIEDAYIEQIDAAGSEVLLANAYFFPTRRFRHALLRAARRGVGVTLLLQGRVEHALQHFASRALYRSLLGAGIRIHEYHSGFLHAKVAVFDGRVATVGSSNVDPFSLGLAQEANVFIDDRGFASELRASLHEAIETGARGVPQNYWRRLSFPLKARIWFDYRLMRLLMSVLGFSRLR